MEKLTKREKILLGVTIVSVGVTGVLVYKYLDANSLLKIKKGEIEKIKDDMNFLKFLIIESGSIPKAKQNGENKLSREESQMKMLVEAMAKSPNNKELKKAYDKHAGKHASIGYELAKLYKLEELMENDENIYAK